MSVLRRRAVLAGGVYIDPAVAAKAYKAMKRSDPASEPTEREAGVLQRVAQGLSNKEIAQRLCLSVKTIETYKARAMHKLGLHSRAEIVRYAAVDDVGRAINPMIVHGQTHGGIAQGVGQALLEHSHYDPTTGQLLAASFMDYAMPRADVFPYMSTALSEVPSPTNRLGVRSGGEGGTTPALAVVINAIVDALSHLGVRHVEMPATPERLWRLIQQHQPRAAAE